MRWWKCGKAERRPLAQDADRLGWLTAQPYAHRGLHGDGVPENSLAAFSAAITAGYGIECDVRKSRCGRAMVFHDAELERLTGQPGLLADRSVGELTGLALLGAADQHIPTLRDVLDLVAGQVPLLLELKTERDRPVSPLCRAVRRDLEGYAGAVAVMSFDPRVPRWFAQHKSAVPRGLVMTEEDGRTLSAAIKRRLIAWHARHEFLAYDVRDLPSAFAALQARRGRPLLSWTVRSAALLEAALAAGATPIMEGAGVAAWAARGGS